MFRRPYKNQTQRKNDYTKRNESRTKMSDSHHDHSECPHSHQHSLLEELFCHTPFAIFALSLSYILFFIINVFTVENSKIFYDQLFHIIHYVHILCAIMSSMMVFNKFGIKNKLVIIFISIINALLFCTLSDIVFPTLITKLIKLDIPIHLCILSWYDSINLGLFALLGIVGGISLLYGHKQQSANFGKMLHFGHIWFGCMAALLYILAHTNIQWFEYAGSLISLLFVAVVIPCVISDVVIPAGIGMYFVSRNNIYSYKNSSDNYSI